MIKKILNFIAGLVVVLFFSHCSKDLGNYDYKEVNRLVIEGVLDGDHNSSRMYRFIYGDSVNISPVITGTLSDSDLSTLDFVWLVDGDTLARTKDLKITSDVIGFGRKVGNFYVTDHSEDVTYNYNFTVEVTSDAPRGHFVLTENEQGESGLFIKSSIMPEAAFRKVNEIGGNPLGNHASGLEMWRNYGSSADNYTYTLITATQGGPYNVMEFLAGDMVPTLLYDNGSMVNGGTELSLTSIFRTQTTGKDSYILNNGKAYVLSRGLISSVIYEDDPLDYDFGEKGLVAPTSLYGKYLIGFDERNSRFRVFGNDWKNNNVFIKNYDNLIDPALTEGHTFVGGNMQIEGRDHYIYNLLSRKGETLFLFKLTFSTAHEPIKFELIASKEVPGLNQLTAAFYNAGNEFWYLAMGRSIYMTSTLGIDVQPVYTLPEDGTGNIVQFSFNYSAASNFTTLGIATYNPDAANAQKGSYYIFDVTTKKITEKLLYSIDKARSIQIGL